MRLYRTIGINEFLKIMYGETIYPKLQKNEKCFYKIKDEYVSAAIQPKKFICTFKENYFWNLGVTDFLLELEIPENLIISTGKGIYYGSVWNNRMEDTHFSKDIAPIYKTLQSGIECTIEEVHLKRYSRKNVVKVYLPDKFYGEDLGKTYDSLSIPYDFIYKKIVTKLGLLTGDTKYIDENFMNKSFINSLFKFKKIIEKKLLNKENTITKTGKTFKSKKIIEFINKIEIYNAENYLMKLLKKSDKMNLIFRELTYEKMIDILETYYTYDFIKIKTLEELPKEKPIEFISLYEEVLEYIKTENKTNWDKTLIQKLIYTFLLDCKLITK